MHEWLFNYSILNIPAYEWVKVISLSIFYFIVIITIWKLLINRLKKLSTNTFNQFDDVLIEVLQSTQKATFAFFAVLMAIRFLDLSDKWVSLVDHITFIVVAIQIALWLTKGITLWGYGKLNTRNGDIPNPVIISMLAWIIKAAVWSILLLTLLANVGVNITAFVASLGIGGVAVALAVQNILSDLFASLSIGLDKPFEIGDFIVFGDVMGNVELIGLKTTHIRSLNGEQIVCSNTELLKNTIHNYKRMSSRRVAFTFGVSYDTTPDDLEKIPLIIKNYLQKIKEANFDRAHFKGFAAHSLEFEVVYNLNTDDFNVYMDTQQALNLAIMRELKHLNIDYVPRINFMGLHPELTT
ncbi:MAG: mechanosensitive ion channel family protein [Bacteroidia bacterium]|nr:mechanosensitive ion channel family protein [Methylotenera sp.]